ncbi:hypothetical protein WME79_28995 [Sorangium sp. So ce726]|uniref:hypothetical protein n=1 Tax=Sorangium sp. So ce726 TaxID=3133319 RepID=UPI003F630973
MLCALCATACASSASNLRPGALDKGQGAIFGRVLVANRGKDITSDCEIYIGGDDSAQGAQAGQGSGSNGSSGGRGYSSANPYASPGDTSSSRVVSLDETGWIFTAVRVGQVYLKQVSCSLGGVAKTPVYIAKDLGFSVHGGDEIAYFGDIVIESDHEDRSGAVAAGVLLGGAIGGLIAGIAVTSEQKPAEVEVANRFDEALREYQTRYGREGGALRPYFSLAGMGSFGVEDSRPSPPPGADPPAAAAGFTLGEDIGAAQGRCSGAGFEWQDLGEGRFSCSGAPADVGAPATVKVTACTGTVCEIAVNASSDSAAWSTLAQRFNRLSRIFDATYGSPSQRRLEPLGDCTDGIKACFDAGRARRRVIWYWPGGRIVALSLDGGAPGDAPRLRVVYGTATPPEGQQQEPRAQPVP